MIQRRKQIILNVGLRKLIVNTKHVNWVNTWLMQEQEDLSSHDTAVQRDCFRKRDISRVINVNLNIILESTRALLQPSAAIP